MKKLAMILIAFMFMFGFTSGAIASTGGGHDYDHGHDDKVTYKDGITTVVTKKKEVTHDKIVKTEKFTDYSTEKKHDKSTFEKVDVDVTKEKHPVHNWYRDVTTKTTYEITKHTTWDEVTKTEKVKKTTTPVKIIKTTVTTKKYKGKPRKGNLISKKTKVYYDKVYGKEHVEVYVVDKKTYKENEKTYYDKKVIDVEVTKGKWDRKDKDHGHDKDKDKGKDRGKGKGKH
ncbi:hypothetical protein B0H99_102157 [Planomicrobium soli]|uniref:Surface rod structure-forming protein G n=1 Tax=Planomicrobium soli TaxID=1176648 RepID=A0A2P8H5I7_9BACL|nr:hypothetical protein [Planomicrobium soli]PSL41473.1 hypothetical protein B0H99_102157 [Planomicrobium soli]